MTRADRFARDRTLAIQGRSIELRHLRIFLAAVDHGSFRKAADRLGIRQSSVSRRICDLEISLGAALFVRHPSGVLMTEAGRCFCPLVRAMIGQLAEATEAIGRDVPADRARREVVRSCAGSTSIPIAATTCRTCEAFRSQHTPLGSGS